jgi:hypothetical protein
MKRRLTLIAAAGLTVVGAFAQGTFGTVFLNNYDSGKGVFDIGGTAPAPTGTIIDILGGPNASSLKPIASALSGQTSYTIVRGDIMVDPPGAGGSFFDYGYGEVVGVAPGNTAMFVGRAWRGAPTYDTATIRGAVTWTQAIGTSLSQLPHPQPAILQFPGLTMVPEPSPIVIAVLGAVALLYCRRK